MKTFTRITHNDYCAQCYGTKTKHSVTFHQKTAKSLPLCGVGTGGGGAEVHGKQKDDKIALYLTALCPAQLLTAEEAVEVINTF